MKLVVDTFEFGTKHVPQWNTISVSGYHIREAGSTALQELAFTLYDGIEYVEWARRAGLDVDDFAPRLSFFFNAHSDLFEELAKYRAARKIWHRVMTERFHCRNPRVIDASIPHANGRLRFDGAATLTTTSSGLRSRRCRQCWAERNPCTRTHSMKRWPCRQSTPRALRCGRNRSLRMKPVSRNTVDPFGGSYFLETLTNNMEKGCWEYFERLDAMGGMVTAIEQGFPQREIQEASYEYQMAVERKEKIIVGVNDFVMRRSRRSMSCSSTNRLPSVRLHNCTGLRPDAR